MDNKPRRASYISRSKRIRVSTPVEVLMRAKGTRAYVFSVNIDDLSETGLLISACPIKVIPFKVGIKVNLTCDLKSRVFERPILMTAKIVRREDCDKKQIF